MRKVVVGVGKTMWLLEYAPEMEANVFLGVAGSREEAEKLVAEAAREGILYVDLREIQINNIYPS